MDKKRVGPAHNRKRAHLPHEMRAKLARLVATTPRVRVLKALGCAETTLDELVEPGGRGASAECVDRIAALLASDDLMGAGR